MRLKTAPIEASVEAMRTSHARARRAPPPAAGPLTAAMTGLGEDTIAWTMPAPLLTSALALFRSRVVRMSLSSVRSAPAQKLRPAPVSTITRHDASSAAARIASATPAATVASKAFKTSGRSRVIVVIDPSRVTDTPVIVGVRSVRVSYAHEDGVLLAQHHFIVLVEQLHRRGDDTAIALRLGASLCGPRHLEPQLVAGADGLVETHFVPAAGAEAAVLDGNAVHQQRANGERVRAG